MKFIFSPETPLISPRARARVLYFFLSFPCSEDTAYRILNDGEEESGGKTKGKPATVILLRETSFSLRLNLARRECLILPAACEIK